MTDRSLLGSWVRRFLLEHMIGERNLSRNTQTSYRDTLCLLLPFAATRSRVAVDKLTIDDLSADCIRAFLTYLESSAFWSGYLSDKLAQKQPKRRMLIHGLCYVAAGPLLFAFLWSITYELIASCMFLFALVRAVGGANANPLLCDLLPATGPQRWDL